VAGLQAGQQGFMIQFQAG